MRIRRHGSLTSVSGRVRGGRVPRAGLRALLQSRGFAGWRTRATLRTDGLGRFSASGRAPAGARLRVVVPAQRGYPYAKRGGAAVTARADALAGPRRLDAPERPSADHGGAVTADGRPRRAADLDVLAAALRERLLIESAADLAPGDVEGRIRALVEGEAALLDEGPARSSRRGWRSGALGLGPLEPLLPTPRSTRSWSRHGAVGDRARGRLARDRRALRSAADLRHVIERILAPLGPSRRRGRAALRRKPARRD